MKTYKNKKHASILTAIRSLSAIVLGAIIVFGLSTKSMAAAPVAGSFISNQASASYLDSTFESKTILSNLVTALVTQVASVVSESVDNTQPAIPGGVVSFPEVITNTGNGPDTLIITATNGTGDSFNLTDVKVLPDNNADGVPDSNIPVTQTPILPPGETIQVIVVGTIPVNVTPGQTGIIDVTTVSTFAPTVVDVTHNIVTITDGPVVTVTQSISKDSGATPSVTPIEIVLTFTNEGLTPGTDLKITETLPPGMAYVPNSGTSNLTGSTPLTDTPGDLQGTMPETIDFSVKDNIITIVITEIPPGDSGSVTFDIVVKADVDAGPITPTTVFVYDDGVGGVTPPSVVNPVTFDVDQTAEVTMTTPKQVDVATQGSTIIFTTEVTNAGNGPDVIDMSVGTSSFPPGTTFILEGPTNVLVDTNGNKIVDTGTLPPDTTITVTTKADLPAGASGGGPYSISLIATSGENPAETTSVAQVITTIAPDTVNVFNSGPSGDTAVVKKAEPGVEVTFPVTIKNETNTGELYVLTVSSEPDLTPPGLPPGWTGTFEDAKGTVVTDTGVIPPGGSIKVDLVIDSPNGQPPTNQDIYIGVSSPTSGALDILHEVVTIVPFDQVKIVLTSPTGVVSPGESSEYPITLTNGGNTPEVITLKTFDDQTATSGWTSTVVSDTNGNGIKDEGDTPVTTVTLGPQEKQDLFLVVEVPPTAVPGGVDTTTLTATGSFPPVTVVSVTTVGGPPPVVTEDTTLLKEQAADVDCNGKIDAGGSFSSAAIKVAPGGCILYQITATNIGAASATNVMINDATPENTTYNGMVPAVTTMGTITKVPSSGQTGPIVASVGTLPVSQSAKMSFGVKVDQ